MPYHAARHARARTIVAVTVVLLCVPMGQARAAASGGPWFYRDRVVVLAFHDVAPEPQTAWCITPYQFETTLSRLQSIGFHYISTDEFRAFLEHGTEVPDDAVLVTIDDGLEDVYTYAWPVLQRLGVPALVNIIGARVDTTPSSLTSAQLRELHASGLVSIGGHSWNLHHTEEARGVMVPAAMAVHPLETSFFRLLSLTRDAERVQKLITGVSGAATPFYACPYGAYDAVYLNSLRRAGFTLVFDSFPGSVTRLSDHERLPRVDIGMRGYTFHQVFLALSRAAISLRVPPAQTGRARRVGGDEELPPVHAGPGVSLAPGLGDRPVRVASAGPRATVMEQQLTGKG